MSPTLVFLVDIEAPQSSDNPPELVLPDPAQHVLVDLAIHQPNDGPNLVHMSDHLLHEIDPDTLACVMWSEVLVVLNYQ